MSEDKKIGYAFRVGAQTADGITIDVTGNFQVGASSTTINAELDNWVQIFARQRAKTLLIEEENTLGKERATLAQLTEQLHDRAETANPKASERANTENIKSNVDRLKAAISAREQGVASLKKLCE